MTCRLCHGSCEVSTPDGKVDACPECYRAAQDGRDIELTCPKCGGVAEYSSTGGLVCAECGGKHG